MTVDYSSLIGTVEDFVFNEDKIVTYKWISNKLKLHVNTAKQLLYSFTTKDDVNSNLLVRYIVSGIKEDGSHTVSLVSSDNLDKIKGSLKVVNSEHVYSVQKNSLSKSINNLYLVDHEAGSKQEKRSAPIQINSDILRSGAEQTTVRPAEKKPEIQPKKNENFPNKLKSSEKIVHPIKENESVFSNDQKEETKSLADTHKGSSVSPTSNHQKTSPKKIGKKGSSKNVPVKGGGISNCFNKQAAIAVEKAVQKSKNNELEIRKTHEVKEVENIPDNSLDNNQKVKKSNESTKSVATDDIKVTGSKKQDKSNVKKRKNSTESDGKNRKKMKRIVIASDSDSSSDEEMEAEEVSPPESPEPVAKPESDDEIIPPTPVEKGKKRVRKEIDQVFVAEDGFLLTKKAYVYKSSDEEVEPEPKPPTKSVQPQSPVKPAKLSPRKNSSPKKNKKSPRKNKSPQVNGQSSIMKFFSKK